MSTSTAERTTLHLGSIAVDPPVVLAPMAGITNVAFRRLCREYGAGLYVCEMITSRALVERDAKTMRMVRFHPARAPRSLQLYGVDPVVVGDAVRMVVAEDLADHVDLNFGCPVPKVTRKGGGAALPWQRRLFASIVRAAVAAADGADPGHGQAPQGHRRRPPHLSSRPAGRAQDDGAAWVALHAPDRRADVLRARPTGAAIARLKDGARRPGAGQRRHLDGGRTRCAWWRETGADGVVVGRGCLGRPWLFGELAAAFAGEPDADAADPRRGRRRHAPSRRAPRRGLRR